MPLVLSDTSTLNHLAAIGRLALLRDSFHKIAIPSAVWREVVEEGRARAGAREVEAARREAWIEILSPSNELEFGADAQDSSQGEVYETVVLAR